MTQEEKQKLLVALCGYLPYHPKMQIYFEDIAGFGTFDEELKDIIYDDMLVNDRHIENIRPYLRPMSSMTEEEKEEERKLWNIVTTTRNDLHYLYTDFLVSHYLDYRGLILAGLALPSKEGMYNI